MSRWWLLLALSVSPAVQAVEVVASIRPLALIADAVMGGQGQVRQLVPNGASAHGYALRPSDRALLARADLVLWVGPLQEHFLPTALRGRPTLAVQDLPGIQKLPARRLADGAEVPGSVDSHLWLSPDNAVVMARALAERLALKDAAQADRYRRNAEAFAARLQQQKAGLLARFRPLQSRPLLAYHDAWHYFDHAMGLNYRGSLTLEPAQKPGAQHVLQMAHRIEQEKIACLLTEPGADMALAQRIFGAQAFRTAVVDELFASTPRGPQGYEAGLAGMAASIQGCLEGSR
jgi:zinc transport system substrate-binding protein